MVNTRSLGRMGEAIAEGYLVNVMHARIMDRNFTVRGGEIDLIAECDGTILFVEVKLRRTSSGLDAITNAKKRRLSYAALVYLSQNHLTDMNARFDVAIVHPPDEVDYIVRAFDYTP